MNQHTCLRSQNVNISIPGSWRILHDDLSPSTWPMTSTSQGARRKERDAGDESHPCPVTFSKVYVNSLATHRQYIFFLWRLNRFRHESHQNYQPSVKVFLLPSFSCYKKQHSPFKSPVKDYLMLNLLEGNTINTQKCSYPLERLWDTWSVAPRGFGYYISHTTSSWWSRHRA